jgi:Lipid A 3-O-deacylase (PagL).
MRIILILFFTGGCLFAEVGKCQTHTAYPPFTKWYQDPLGLKPLELSTAFGFVWGSAAIATSLIFTKKDHSLQKKMSLYYETGFSTGYKWPYTPAFQNEIGCMYNVRKWMSIGMGCNAFHFKDEVNNTWCFGMRPFARWYPYTWKKARFYFEYGAGLCYSLNRFPFTGTGWEADTARTGTKFNLTSKYGIGAEINFNKRFSLQLGIRHFHLSNGNIVGIKRNPSHDSNGLFVGLIYN